MQSVLAVRVVVDEEDRSVTKLMPPEDGPLGVGSNLPTQVTHAERVGGDLVSPTESELLRDMEDMLDGWEPDLDEVFREVVDPEATLLPLIPRDWRTFPGGTVLTESVIRMLRHHNVNVTITADGAVTALELVFIISFRT
ncbi:hypothetical protein ACLKA6_000450 [Drosophila palustris]